VRLLDGGTLSERVIGFYCGHLAAFTVLSTQRDIMIQFVSDRQTPQIVYNATAIVHRGFHAVFSYQRQNGTLFTDDAVVDSSRYIDIGAHSPDWNADLNYVDDSQGTVQTNDNKVKSEMAKLLREEQERISSNCKKKP